MRLVRSLVCLAPLVAGTGACSLCATKPPTYEPFETFSGVEVQDLVVPESGTAAQPGDHVTIDYRIELPDGTLADSSHERGRPITFRLGAGQVPRGLDEGLVGMTEMGRRRLRVPPELAYGSQGRPPRIPPDTPLTFFVELLKIEVGG